MYIKKLSFIISRVLVAGCVGFAFTGTVSAYSNPSNFGPSYSGSSQSGGYWQGLSPARFDQYKFRPVDTHRQSYSKPRHIQKDNSSRQVRDTGNMFSRFQMPSFSSMPPAFAMPAKFVMPARFAMPGMVQGSQFQRPHYGSFNTPSRVLAENNRYYRMGRYSRPLTPAFARQYGWTPANNMVVRKGGGSDHYASEMNAGFAQQTVTANIPEYRTEPVTKQGFKYRTINRNPGHVSFADKLRHLVPQQNMNTYRSEKQLAVKADTWQKLPPVTSPMVPSAMPSVSPSTVQAQVLPETKVMAKPNNALVQVNASGYRFRPDDRFENQVSQSSVSQTNRGAMPYNAPVNKMAPDDFKLANAKMESNNPDASGQWFFRPSQPSPF